MSPILRLLWIPRLLLLIVFIPHALSKVSGYAAFADKFHLDPVLIVLLTVAEFAGVVGVLLGGLPIEPWARWATYLAALVLGGTQLAAITVVHAPAGWFTFQGGAEFNVVLVGLCVLLAVGHAMSVPPPARAHG